MYVYIYIIDVGLDLHTPLYTICTSSGRDVAGGAWRCLRRCLESRVWKPLALLSYSAYAARTSRVQRR